MISLLLKKEGLKDHALKIYSIYEAKFGADKESCEKIVSSLEKGQKKIETKPIMIDVECIDGLSIMSIRLNEKFSEFGLEKFRQKLIEFCKSAANLDSVLEINLSFPNLVTKESITRIYGIYIREGFDALNKFDGTLYDAIIRNFDDIKCEHKELISGRPFVLYVNKEDRINGGSDSKIKRLDVALAPLGSKEELDLFGEEVIFNKDGKIFTRLELCSYKQSFLHVFSTQTNYEKALEEIESKLKNRGFMIKKIEVQTK